jgi:hypothetical protein
LPATGTPSPRSPRPDWHDLRANASRSSLENRYTPCANAALRVWIMRWKQFIYRRLPS